MKIEIPENVTLEVIKGEDKGRIHTITNKTITIGRNEVCDFKLNDKYASNKHCQIVYRKEHFTAIDLRSLNKTKVNGKVYVQKNLQDEDIIRLGKTEIKFSWDIPETVVIDESEDILADVQSDAELAEDE